MTLCTSIPHLFNDRHAGGTGAGPQLNRLVQAGGRHDLQWLCQDGGNKDGLPLRPGRKARIVKNPVTVGSNGQRGVVDPQAAYAMLCQC